MLQITKQRLLFFNSNSKSCFFGEKSKDYDVEGQDNIFFVDLCIYFILNKLSYISDTSSYICESPV